MPRLFMFFLFCFAYRHFWRYAVSLGDIYGEFVVHKIDVSQVDVGPFR